MALTEKSIRYYLATSRQLKRLEAASRSPMFAWFSETLDGLSSIRAFNQQCVFIAGLQRRIDMNQDCYLMRLVRNVCRTLQPNLHDRSVTVNRWLAVRLEFVGAATIFVTGMLGLLALGMSGVDAGMIGFVLSYASNITVSLVRARFSTTHNIAHESHCRVGWCVPPVKSSEMPSALSA